MVFLEVNGLSFKYSSSKGPVYAVDDVDFSLEDKESIGIAGESACGKSTLGLSLIRTVCYLVLATKLCVSQRLSRFG